MKVALITFLFDAETGGGAANSAQRLAHGLVEQGHQVVVVTTQRNRGARTVVRNEHLKVHYFRPLNFYWVADKDEQPAIKKVLWQVVDIWNPHVYRHVSTFLKREQPQVVHIHKLRGLSPAVWAAARAAGAQRIVQTCRDYELMSPEGTLSSRVGKWAAEGAFFIRPYQKLRASFSKAVDVATAPSAYTLRKLTDRGFFPQAQHLVVPNTHGLSQQELDDLRQQVQQLRARQPDKRFRVLYLGRLERIKGVDTLLEAFSTLVNEHPVVCLDIVGWGSEAESLERAYDNHPQITFRGPLFGAEKTAALAQSDVMVVPSIWPEVFGNVVVEAYAHGLPVVATKAGGLPELIVDGETGTLVPAADPQALTGALANMLNQRQQLPEMRTACYAAARQYAVEITTARYLNAYGMETNENKAAESRRQEVL